MANLESGLRREATCALVKVPDVTSISTMQPVSATVLGRATPLKERRAMAAYVLAEIDVQDPSAYEEYKKLAAHGD